MFDLFTIIVQNSMFCVSDYNWKKNTLNIGRYQNQTKAAAMVLHSESEIEIDAISNILIFFFLDRFLYLI